MTLPSTEEECAVPGLLAAGAALVRGEGAVAAGTALVEAATGVGVGEEEAAFVDFGRSP